MIKIITILIMVMFINKAKSQDDLLYQVKKPEKKEIDSLSLKFQKFSDVELFEYALKTYRELTPRFDSIVQNYDVLKTLQELLADYDTIYYYDIACQKPNLELTKYGIYDKVIINIDKDWTDSVGVFTMNYLTLESLSYNFNGAIIYYHPELDDISCRIFKTTNSNHVTYITPTKYEVVSEIYEFITNLYVKIKEYNFPIGYCIIKNDELFKILIANIKPKQYEYYTYRKHDKDFIDYPINHYIFEFNKSKLSKFNRPLKKQSFSINIPLDGEHEIDNIFDHVEGIFRSIGVTYQNNQVLYYKVFHVGDKKRPRKIRPDELHQKLIID